MPPTVRTLRRIAPAALAVAVLAPVVTAAPASAAANDRGLFGAQDPTYDGVYRQGLAVTGLAAADRTIPRRAVTWLLRQQCPNGSFLSYRPDPAAACPKADPAAYSGPDSNSTALGALALWAAGERQQAKKAAKYLRTLQTTDGGFAYYRGGTSDTNSTGLALAALDKVPVRRAAAARTDARRYLRSVQVRCAAPKADRGLLSYQRQPKTPNYLASAQAGIGLVTSFPPAKTGAGRTSQRLRCVDGKQRNTTTVADALLDALQAGLERGDGLLPNQFGGGSDHSASAQAVIALAAARRAKGTVAESVRALRRAADTYTGSGTPTPNAGALGTLLNLTAVTGTDPKRFGGVHLPKELVGTMRRSAR